MRIEGKPIALSILLGLTLNGAWPTHCYIAEVRSVEVSIRFVFHNPKSPQTPIFPYLLGLFSNGIQFQTSNFILKYQIYFLPI